MQRLLCGYVRFRSGFNYLLSNVFCNLLLVRKLKYILLNECSAVLNIIIGPPAIQLQPSTPLYHLEEYQTFTAILNACTILLMVGVASN